MKTFIIILSFVLSFSSASFAQTVKKETLKVNGNCDMCQSKIEKAAKSAGATTASWDVDSKVLTVAYNPAKASMEKIGKAIAKAGYDNDVQATTEAAFNKLPGCCKYDRKDAATPASTEEKH